MEIQKDSEGKWIRAGYGMYLTQKSAIKDEDRVIVRQVHAPDDQSNDEWEEITQSDVDRINKAKKAAHGEVFYPEEEVNQMIGLMTANINNMSLTDEQRIQYTNLHPKWEDYIGKSLKSNFFIQYLKKLYKTRQEILTVLDQDSYRPGEDGSDALYEEVNETNKGTIDDPIPYNGKMELFEGKYYIQNGVKYKCTRDTGQAVSHSLEDLVGQYVEKV